MIKYMIAFTVIILITLNVTPSLVEETAKSVDRVETIETMLNEGMGK